MTVEQFKKIKLALFDFDDTLCIHTKHTNDYETIYYKAMLSGNADYWTKQGFETNPQMKELLKICKEAGMTMGLISAVSIARSAELKVQWVMDNYGYKLNNYCVSTAKTKITAIKILSNLLKLKPDEILFVDDLYSTVMEAAELGVYAISPLEAINLVHKIKGDEHL